MNSYSKVRVDDLLWALGAFEEPRDLRLEWRARIAKLREQGLTYAQIVERVGETWTGRPLTKTHLSVQLWHYRHSPPVTKVTCVGRRWYEVRMRKDPLYLQALNLLSRSDGGLSDVELAETMGVSKQMARQYLYRLRSAGLINGPIPQPSLWRAVKSLSEEKAA